MHEKRRFNRVTCLEKLAVGFDGNIIRAELLDISLKGALVEFENDVTFQNGDIWTSHYRWIIQTLYFNSDRK